MITENARNWSARWKEEGLRKGLEEGRQLGMQQGLAEGRRSGESELLLRQLSRKFGPLDAATRKRISEADVEALLEWGERFVDATCLAEVLGDG